LDAQTLYWSESVEETEELGGGELVVNVEENNVVRVAGVDNFESDACCMMQPVGQAGPKPED
jgi:hypothetical protein